MFYIEYLCLNCLFHACFKKMLLLCIRKFDFIYIQVPAANPTFLRRSSQKIRLYNQGTLQFTFNR